MTQICAIRQPSGRDEWVADWRTRRGSEEVERMGSPPGRQRVTGVAPRVHDRRAMRTFMTSREPAMDALWPFCSASRPGGTAERSRPVSQVASVRLSRVRDPSAHPTPSSAWSDPHQPRRCGYLVNALSGTRSTGTSKLNTILAGTFAAMSTLRVSRFPCSVASTLYVPGARSTNR